MKTRILFLIDKLVPAGTQSNLLEIVRHLDHNRFEPAVIALQSGGELAQAFKAAGVEPTILNVKRAYGLSGFRAFIFLYRFMRRNKIEIVQNHFLQADLLGTLAGRLAGVKAVFTTRRDEGFWRSARQIRLNRFLNRFADAVLVNSNAVASAVTKTERVTKPIRKIYNGVDSERFRPDEKKRAEMRKSLGLNPAEVAVAVVANMNHVVKGHRCLLNAVARMAQEKVSFKVFLIGEGKLRRELESETERLGIKKHIVFLGRRQDVPDLLQAMDIGCLPSLSEGFSNAILEYAAVGLPSVATAVGGNTEAIKEGRTGFLIPAGNAESLADKLLQLIRDRNVRCAMGEAARKQILESFTIETMCRSYEDIYAAYSRKKIMYVIWSLDLGGAEQVVMNLGRGIDRKLFEPVVCCINEKGRYAPEMEKEGIRVFALGKIGKLDILFFFRLLSLIRKERPDLIHTHLFTANLWGRLAARWCGVPVVSTEHNMDTWKKTWHFSLDRSLAPSTRRIVFVSDMVKQFYDGKISSLNGKASVIYNGIDIERFNARTRKNTADLRASLGIRAGAKVIGTVGRLVPQKGHRYFIDALGTLRTKGYDVMGLVVGDGPLLAELRHLVHEKKLSEQIIFSGFRSDMAEMYGTFDLFVLSSLREGFPMTILEAMAAGVPVVAANVGGVAECIDHGNNGLLVSPGESAGLAQAMEKLLTDGALRERVIKNAREKVEKFFSIKRMTHRHEMLYEEVLSAEKQPL